MVVIGHHSYLKKMDHTLTKKIQDYLALKAKDRDVTQGATLLLSLNRNNIMFQQIIRCPDKYADKVEYELRKHLAIRLNDKTVADVLEMNKTVVPNASDSLKLMPVVSSDCELPEGVKAKGMRSDHNDLPDEIKALWDESSNLYFKIKELFETLKGMESAPACDRFELLKQLDELDKRYRDNLKTYDNYSVVNELEGSNHPADGNTNTNPDDLVKKVTAARTYLSQNRDKLAGFKDTDEKKYKELLAKVQERYDLLLSTNSTVSPEQTAELKELGVKVVEE